MRKKKDCKIRLKIFNVLEFEKETHVETSTEGKPWLQNLFQKFFGIISVVLEIFKIFGYFPHNFFMRVYGLFNLSAI